MQTTTIQLYSHFGLQAPENAVGRLTCYHVSTSLEVSANRRKPAVLILPGGGYFMTSQREMEPIALHFLTRGYAAFVLEYSCVPHKFPTALREAAMAMRYIRENADAFEVNPCMVAAIGFSAGGHLCGTLGTLYDCEEVSDIGSAELLRPDALGLCYPVALSCGRTHDDSFYNVTGRDPELTKRLSLDNLVRSDMPPVFLWHTRDDTCVPCRNSILLAAALEEIGVDFALHIYRQGQHGLSTADEMVFPAGGVPRISGDVTDWLGAMIDFFGECGFAIHDAK